MVELHLYVEGGGDSKALHSRCREGFRKFLEQAGLKGHMPRIVACGGRDNAFSDFKTAVAHGRPAMLLVDSEGPMAAAHEFTPWAHLKARDGWTRPTGASDEQCHLMVQCMETWLLIDRATLKAFFGQGFKLDALPAANRQPEKIAKAEVYSALAKATKDCKTKAIYGKGEHSFELLGKVDPGKVTAASPWAARFVDELREATNAA